MSKFEVEKDIEIPAKRHGPSKYPWAEMEVGDSFFVEGPAPKTQRCLAVCAGGQRRRHGTRFTTRQCENGVRVWRIE